MPSTSVSLISENTAFDSTDQVLKRFANVELLLYRNRLEESHAELTDILEKHPNHAIIDDVYWQLSKLELTRQRPESALEHLEKILEAYAHDILADDAAFKKSRDLPPRNFRTLKKQRHFTRIFC